MAGLLSGLMIYPKKDDPKRAASWFDDEDPYEVHNNYHDNNDPLCDVLSLSPHRSMPHDTNFSDGSNSTSPLASKLLD